MVNIDRSELALTLGPFVYSDLIQPVLVQKPSGVIYSHPEISKVSAHG